MPNFGNIDLDGPSALAAERTLLEVFKFPFSELNKILCHAVCCAGCLHPDCYHMKKSLAHWYKCPRSSRRCAVCHRLVGLMRYHARYCQLGLCNVPSCPVTRFRKELKEDPAAEDLDAEHQVVEECDAEDEVMDCEGSDADNPGERQEQQVFAQSAKRIKLHMGF